MPYIMKERYLLITTHAEEMSLCMLFLEVIKPAIYCLSTEKRKNVYTQQTEFNVHLKTEHVIYDERKVCFDYNPCRRKSRAQYLKSN